MSALKILVAFLLMFVAFYCNAQETQLIYNDTSYIYRSISEASVHPEKVFRLNLSKKKIDTIPDLIYSMTNLIELDLSKNKIEEISPRIGNLVNLEKLSMANNQLVHLPKEIGQLTNLKYLGLNRNVIEDLPAEIGNLENLEVLELWDNELNDVPDEISKLQNLKVLEIRGILFTDEQAARIDSLVTKTAKILISPSCNCKY